MPSPQSFVVLNYRELVLELIDLLAKRKLKV
jgi:hypothetical protein